MLAWASIVCIWTHNTKYLKFTLLFNVRKCWHSGSPEWKRERVIYGELETGFTRPSPTETQFCWPRASPFITTYRHVTLFIITVTHTGQTVFKIQRPFREDSGKGASSHIRLWAVCLSLSLTKIRFKSATDFKRTFKLRYTKRKEWQSFPFKMFKFDTSLKLSVSGPALLELQL